MNTEQAKKLLIPFPPEQIGKLPRAATKAAKEANKKGNCAICGKYHVLPAIHLDYASHAIITRRLIEEDPEWTWEPMAVDATGAPVITNGGLWIKLTVHGKTLPGFGDAEGGRGIKEMIGDALRNGAMRFGVGLDLWIKEDLHVEDVSQSAGATAPVAPVAPVPAQAGATASPFAGPNGLSTPATPKQKQTIKELLPKVAEATGDTLAKVKVDVRKLAGCSFTDMTEPVAGMVILKLEDWIGDKPAQEQLGGGVK